MAFPPELLAAIEKLLSEPGVDRRVLSGLRQRLPGLSLTLCDQSDVDGETAYREFERFSLYLVDGSDHCWRLTVDPAQATGIVVAQHKVAS